MNVRNVKFHENPSSDSKAYACGQRHDEANRRFSRFVRTCHKRADLHGC
jgi:hypothetical protein